MYHMMIITALLLSTAFSISLTADPTDEFRFALYSQYLDETHCDITIQSGKVQKKAHKVVLVTIPYFSILLSGYFKESETGILEMTETIPPHLLALVLEFIYTSSIQEVTFEHLLELFSVAHQLDLKVLAESLLNYYEKSIGIETSFRIMHILEVFAIHNTVDLDEQVNPIDIIAISRIYRKAEVYFMEHLPTISK